MKQIYEAVQDQIRERHKISAAILDFLEEAENAKIKLQGKFPRANMHTENI